MLKERVITGAVLAAIATAAIAFLPSNVFAIVTLVILVGVGAWEWAGLTGVTETFPRLLAPLPAVLIGQFLLIAKWPVIPVLMMSVVVWAIILGLLATYQRGTDLYSRVPILLKVMGVLVLVPAWYALSHLHGLHYGYVFYVIGLVALADIAAYFTGKRFGKTKLAPELSPGKTREGMFGAMAVALVWAVIGAFMSDLPQRDWFTFVLLSLVVAVMSVAGDLFESLVKREAGVKDSGSILPGHGGILDRIDSLVAAVPLFTLGLLWIKMG